MPVSKRSRRRALRAQEDKQLITPNRALGSPGKPEPFWGWIDLGLYVAGMLLLVAGLYQIVLHFRLSAAAAGAITDVPGPLAILYLILRGRTVWRGAVLPVILRHAKPLLAAFLTGIAFSLEHVLFRERFPSLSTLLSITLTGTAYGLVRIQTQSTLTAALMHGCYNLTLFFWQGA
jgi:membrane protease YdiL (CAAX protease family)